MSLPSELEFFSFLQYAPQGTSSASRTSRAVCYAVKTDSFTPPGTFWVIKESALRIAEKLGEFPFLNECFGPDVVLIPMPRSSPLSANNALWPSLRICEELLKQGLALDILPVVVREKAVTKAATAGPGKRPGPAEHYESCRVNLKQLPFIAARITLVDDVITQGSTFLGIYPLVQEAFSRSKINCFALIRTMSGVSIDAMLDPVRGKIIFAQGTFLRNP